MERLVRFLLMLDCGIEITSVATQLLPPVTPKQEMDLVRNRLTSAEADYRLHHSPRGAQSQ